MLMVMGASEATADLGVEGVGAGLGHGEPQVVDAAIGEHAPRSLRGVLHDEAHEGEVVAAGRDLEVDHPAHASALGGAGHGQRRLGRGRERERSVEPGELEGPPEVRPRRHEPEVTAVGAGSLQGADDHPEPEGVHEVDALEIEHDVGLAAGHEVDQLGPQAGRRRHVEVAVDADHDPAVVLLDTDGQIHGPNLPEGAMTA